MQRWQPDTCYCSIISPRPSIRGTFEKRCRIHKRSSITTLDVYAHNLANRLTPQEFTTIRVSDPELPQSLIDKLRHFLPLITDPSSDLVRTTPTKAGIERKRLLKESTR